MTLFMLLSAIAVASVVFNYAGMVRIAVTGRKEKLGVADKVFWLVLLASVLWIFGVLFLSVRTPGPDLAWKLACLGFMLVVCGLLIWRGCVDYWRLRSVLDKQQMR
jgi:hypothetical protein